MMRSIGVSLQGRGGLLGLFLCVILAGCASASPKFDPQIQKAFRDQEMRRLETERLKIYYPAPRYEEAMRVAGRLEGCLDEVEALQPRPRDWGLIPVFMPEMEFNNAYVAYGPGLEPHVVLPTYFTANIFGDFGFTPSIGAVGCHELVHYLHMTQIHGVFGAVNKLLGPSLNPQIGLDSWVFEGLATYFESRLVEGVGRYGSPLWQSLFAAGIAEDHLNGGRLSAYDRAIPVGGQYLIGSQFIGYLAEKYGEEKLWRFVDRQGSSFFFPLGVSLRFFMVYGKPLGTLIDDFVAHSRQQYPVRRRGPEQEREQWVGRSARFETGPGGRWALYSRDVDKIGTIEVFDGAGERILRRQVPDILPGRQLVGFGALEALRFSPDGERLYFLAYHQGRDLPRTSLMQLDIATNRLRVVRDEVKGIGGDITPDGGRFILATPRGDRVAFRSLDLVGSRDRDLFELPAGAYVGWVRVSPDGERLAFTLMEEEEWSVAVVELESGEFVGRWTTGESQRPVFDARWLDDARLLFVASMSDGVQIVEGALGGGEVLRRSNVPYMASSPAEVDGGELRFLNREGWGWSLDRLSGGVARPTQQVQFIGTGQGVVADREAGAIRGYRPVEKPARAVDDRPYSAWEGLFVPRLRIPFIGYDFEQWTASVEMSGRDEMGFHNWAVAAGWEFGHQRLSLSLAYINMQLAPFILAAQVGQNWTNIVEILDLETLDLSSHARRERVAMVQVLRQFYDIPVGLQFLGIDFYEEAHDELPEQRRALVGPGVSAQYRAGRSSAYGGAQWLLGASTDLAYYPEELGSDFSLGDWRGQLEVHTPLPFSGRHRLRISGRGRALTGVPGQDNLLHVGGFGGFSPLFVSRQTEEVDINDELTPPGFVFVEPLRGYEDFGFGANQAVIVDVDYRYPLIVDRGAASVMMVFPSVFFQGIDLEGFASAATLLDGNYHAAVGASVDMKFMIWVLPFQLRYQVAQRLLDDERLVHSVSFGVGM